MFTVKIGQTFRICTPTWGAVYFTIDIFYSNHGQFIHGEAGELLI